MKFSMNFLKKIYTYIYVAVNKSLSRSLVAVVLELLFSVLVFIFL